MTQTPITITGDSDSNFALLTALTTSPTQSMSLQFSETPAATELRLAVTDSGHLRDFSTIERNILVQESSQPNGVEFLPMKRLISPQEKDGIKTAMHAVLDSGQFTSGPYVSKLETTLAQWTGIQHAIGTCSGTEAMVIGLLALGIGPGDEVIIPANSFAATENAVFLVGATPVLADIDTQYTLAPESVARVVTPKTKAIIPVHLYGKLTGMEALRQVADAHKLAILEDACQSIGVTGLGRYADIAALSFNPFKNFSVCGKAGALLVHDDALAHRCRAVGYHGFDPDKKNVKATAYGLNARIDNLQAAIALARFPFLGLRNFKRLCLAHRYDKKLQSLCDQGHVVKPSLSPDHVWHHYTVETRTLPRDRVRQHMHERYGIETDIYYPILTHHYETPTHRRLFENVDLPRTNAAAHAMFQLPMYPELSLEEQDRVVAALEQTFLHYV
ncbi:DegT/DnrJ/EryC1/StrS family aminotransferase [Desulfovibrio inopinatus]|uniref:DegT/DnrJ/EryC1/StrS family aminotransferase n=1 Tax=Desulfovibrio inopinatus TaxID=102109 RepID=UPI00040929EC|nr:DegT/DnrJ/EryC1/StrS family aminotransferase [Desulfovibrio inopinatus]